jgi:hypothetical protein
MSTSFAMTSAPAPEARNGHHVKNTTSLGNPSRQQKYRQSKLQRPLGTSTPSTNFLNWMRRRGTMTWMSGNRSRK